MPTTFSTTYLVSSDAIATSTTTAESTVDHVFSGVMHIDVDRPSEFASKSQCAHAIAKGLAAHVGISPGSISISILSRDQRSWVSLGSIRALAALRDTVRARYIIVAQDEVVAAQVSTSLTSSNHSSALTDAVSEHLGLEKLDFSVKIHTVTVSKVHGIGPVGLTDIDVQISGVPFSLLVEGWKLSVLDRVGLLRGECGDGLTRPDLVEQPISVENDGVLATWRVLLNATGNWSACWCDGSSLCIGSNAFSTPVARVVVHPQKIAFSAPSVLAPCEDLLVEIQSLPQEQVSVQWQCQPADAPLCEELRAYNLTGSAAGSSRLVLPAARVQTAAAAALQAGQANTTVVLRATAFGLHGREWLGEHMLLALSADKVVLRARPGPRTFTILDKYIVLEVVAQRCVDRFVPALDMSWSWQAHPARGFWTPVQVEEQRKMSLRLPVAELPGIGKYTIRGSARGGEAADVLVEVSIVSIPPPDVVLTAPAMAGISCPFSLDASRSSDPGGETLMFSWKCSASNFTSESSKRICAELAAEATGSILHVPGRALEEGNYTFTVDLVTGVPPRRASANTTVLVTSAQGPTVALAMPPSEVSMQMPLSLRARASSESGNCSVVNSWQAWWIVPIGDVNASLLYRLPATSNLNLFIPAPLPFAPGIYRLRLVLSNSAEASWQNGGDDWFAFDSTSFMVDAPPSGGRCSISPSVGVALNTTFEVSSVDWQDDDLPLMHRFLQRAADPAISTWTALRTWDLDAHFFSLLGVGSLMLLAEVRDSLGSVSQASAQVVVQSPPQQLSGKQLLSIANVVANTSDGMAMLAVCAAAVNTASIDGLKPGDENRMELASGLIDILSQSEKSQEPSEDSIALTATTLLSVLDFSVDDVSATDSSGSRTEGPLDTRPAARAPSPSGWDVSVAFSAAPVVLEIARKASAAGVLSNNTANELVDSVAVLLSAVDTGDRASNQTPAGKSKRSASDKLQESLTVIGDGVAATALNGTEVCMGKRGLEMCVVPESANVLQKRGSKIGSFVIPALTDLAMQCAPAEPVNLQHVTWPSNPFGYRGNSTSAASELLESEKQTAHAHSGTSRQSAQQTSVVESSRDESCGTCGVIDNLAVQTMHVRCGSREVMVNNLSDPIVFELNAQSVPAESTVETYDPNLEYEELLLSTRAVQSCYFWDAKMDSWSTRGCRLVEALNGSIQCECNHLSSFSCGFYNTFGSLGRNRADLLSTPTHIEWSNPQVQVLLVWIVMLCLPAFAFAWKDRKDYFWLSERADLFKDVVPHGSHDTKCTLCPSVRICDGLIMFNAVRINCSSIARKLRRVRRKCCFCLYRYEKTSGVSAEASHQPPLPQSTLQVDKTGPKVAADCAGVLGNQLLTDFTEPPLRQEVVDLVYKLQQQWEALSSMERMLDKLANQVSRIGVKVARGRLGALAVSLHIVRRLRRGTVRHSHLKKESGEYRSTLEAIHVELCHHFIRYLNGEWWRLQSENQQNCWRRIRNLQAERRTARDMSVLSAMMDDLTLQFFEATEHDARLRACPLLPPLLAMRVQLLNGGDLDSYLGSFQEDRRAQLSISKGKKTKLSKPRKSFFCWPKSPGILMFHQAKQTPHARVHVANQATENPWRLTPDMQSLAVQISGNEPIEVVQNDQDADLDAFVLSVPLDCGFKMLMQTDENLRGQGQEMLTTWCATMSNPLYWPKATRDTEVKVILSSRPFGWLARPRASKGSSRMPTRVGLILTEIVGGGYAESLGLRPGMALLTLAGECVCDCSTDEIANLLFSAMLPLEVSFSEPLLPDSFVDLPGVKDYRMLGISCQGLVVTSVDPDRESCGLGRGDEIVQIQGQACWNVLGERKAADEAFALAQDSSTVVVGIRHALAEARADPLWASLHRCSSIFRYRSAAQMPHTATGPFVLSMPGDEQAAEICMGWHSHGSAVISLQPLRLDFCLGIYLSDIAHVSHCEEVPLICRPIAATRETTKDTTQIVAEEPSSLPVVPKSVQPDFGHMADAPPTLRQWRLTNLLEHLHVNRPEHKQDGNASNELEVMIDSREGPFESQISNGMTSHSSQEMQAAWPSSQWRMLLVLQSDDSGREASTHELSIGCFSAWAARLLRASIMQACDAVFPNHIVSKSISLRRVSRTSSLNNPSGSHVGSFDDLNETGCDMSRAGKLHVDIWSCTSLTAADLNGFSDTYVQILFTGLPETVTMQPEHARTEVILRTLNPTWASRHCFTRTGDQSAEGDEAVVLEVWDWDTMSGSTFLGKAVLPWPTAAGYHQHQLALQTDEANPDEECGIITCCLYFEPQGISPSKCMSLAKALPNPLLVWAGTLRVHVQYARDLMHSGTCRPFVSVYIPVECEEGMINHVVPWCTGISSSRSPGQHAVWMEMGSVYVNFPSSQPPVQQIRFDVVNVTSGKKHQIIGYAFLPLPTKVGSENHTLELHDPRVEDETPTHTAATAAMTATLRRLFHRPDLPKVCSEATIATKSLFGLQRKPKLEVEIMWEAPFPSSARSKDSSAEQGEISEPSEARSSHTKLTHSLKKLRSTSKSDLKHARSKYVKAYEVWSHEAEKAKDEQLRQRVIDVVNRLGYQFWGTWTLLAFLFKREHFFPKLFPYVPSLTRVERWAILATAMQVAFFFASLLFMPDCHMVPKPAICDDGANNFVERYLPTWGTFFAAIYGLVLSMPTPLALNVIMRKHPVVEQCTAHEKRIQILNWRLWTTLGYTAIILINGFILWWLMIFVSEYSWQVFSKWLASAVQSLLHRWITAPGFRALVYSTFLLLSKVTPVCDGCLILCPFVFPAVAVSEDHETGVDDLDEEADAVVDENVGYSFGLSTW